MSETPVCASRASLIHDPVSHPIKSRLAYVRRHDYAVNVQSLGRRQHCSMTPPLVAFEHRPRDESRTIRGDASATPPPWLLQ